MQTKNTQILNTGFLLTLAEIAQRWGCPYNAAHRRLHQASVPIVALGPGRFRVRLSELIKVEKGDA